MRVIAPRGTTRDGKVFVDSRYMSETAVGEAGFRGMDERPETPADGEIVEHAILSEQRDRASNSLSRISMSGIPGCSVARNTNLIGWSPKRLRSCPGSADVWPMHSSTTTRSIRFMTRSPFPASRGPRNCGDFHTTKSEKFSDLATAKAR